jgi:hypothetical protein
MYTPGHCEHLSDLLETIKVSIRQPEVYPVLQAGQAV